MTSNCLMPLAHDSDVIKVHVLPEGISSSMRPVFDCCHCRAHVLKAANAGPSSAVPLHDAPKSEMIFLTTAEVAVLNVVALDADDGAEMSPAVSKAPTV